jgi:hypothetical protein
MACASCTVSPSRCSFPEAEKRERVPLSQISPGDNVAFRLSAKRLWKVLHVWQLGPAVALDMECRVRRVHLIAPSAQKVLVRVWVGRCGAPCCELHARDLGGRHLCQQHW